MTFITIWELSLVGTIAILVVLLLRKLSRSKVSYAAMVALWEIVLIRLLVPISMPNAISPLGTFHKLWQMQQPQTGAMAEGTYPGSGEKMILMDGGQVEGVVSEETSQAASIQLSELLKLIWLVGMMIAIGISFIYFKRSMKVINEALPIEEKNDLGAGLNLGGNKVRYLTLRKN